MRGCPADDAARAALGSARRGYALGGWIAPGSWCAAVRTYRRNARSVAPWGAVCAKSEMRDSAGKRRRSPVGTVRGARYTPTPDRRPT